MSMATNMTYESKGDIQPAPPSQWLWEYRTEASTKDKFACDDLVTRGVLSRSLSSFLLSSVFCQR